MNGGITFNGEGPLMTGTWYNPSNGDSFTVADSFFQDNQYIVKTTDGRMLDYNFIQHYIKSDKPIEIPKKETSSPLPAEVQSIIAGDILPEDQLLIQGETRPIGNLYATQPTQDISNAHIINKALNKKTLPKIITTIDWEDFPQKEFDMLIDVMDINKEEILEWYINKLDINQIRSIVKESLTDWINHKMTMVNDTNPTGTHSENETDQLVTNVTSTKSTRSHKKSANKTR